MIDDLVKKGQAKLAQFLDTYLKALDTLFFLRRFEPHDEHYELDFRSSYSIIDSSKARNGPSLWRFTKEDVFPHK